MRLLALSLIALAFAGAGCGGSDEKKVAVAVAPAAMTQDEAIVDIKSFEYKPVTVAVRKGGRVGWTNSDAAAHTATADDRSFDTQTIDKGKSATVSFTTRGTFAYHCDFHPFMKATVVVR